MDIFIKFIICFIAGLGAGIGTGFAGMSAAAAITPMLVTFLGMPAYEAVGIALASDVLASGVSAYTYGKNKNLDIKNGLIMMAAVLCYNREKITEILLSAKVLLESNTKTYYIISMSKWTWIWNEWLVSNIKSGLCAYCKN